MKRRNIISSLLGGALAIFAAHPRVLYARTFMTGDQARRVIFGGESMTRVPVTLTKEQMKSIQSVSKTRVRESEMQVWRTSSGGWFILDQVIGKHENIDLAVGLTAQGKVKGLEVLVYRETYGHEIRHPKWMAQFHGRGPGKVLKLDKDIKNISGATLSCRHVTDGVNRWVETWNQVLRHL